VAISEEIVTSLVEAVAALNTRVNDAASRPMIQGPQGEAGPQGERGEDAPPVTDEQIKDAAENWLRENITQPRDGVDGQDGQQGPQGRPPTDDEIQLAVDIWFEIHRSSLVGPAGSDGRDGVDGRDGRDGVDGRNGVDGRAGPAGVGIALVEQRDETSFWITLTDGQEFQIELPAPLRGGGSIGSIYDIDAYFNSLAFDLTPRPKAGVGVMQWNVEDGTLDLGLLGGNVTLQVGQETVHRVVNKTGATILNGQAVYGKGAAGQRLEVALALANSDNSSATIIGIATEDIPNNQSGYITSEGLVRSLNTSAFEDGDALYLSPTIAGALTKVKPVAPQHLVFMGFVIKGGSVGAGSIFVHPQNGYELDELHNVLITSPTNGQVLSYDSALAVWKNTTGSGGGGATSLADLTDVAISGVLNQDVLQYDVATGLWRNNPAIIDGGTFS
jgi:hypothetical protein